MKSNTTWKIVAVCAVGLAVGLFWGIQHQGPPAEPSVATHDRQQPAAVPSTGRVTLIDLGANACVPCKMMAPILDELKKEYAGRADIIFIDVWKDPAQAQKYGVRAIPTQIFFDTAGREVHRHVGFMDKQQIVAILTRLGVS